MNNVKQTIKVIVYVKSLIFQTLLFSLPLSLYLSIVPSPQGKRYRKEEKKNR